MEGKHKKEGKPKRDRSKSRDKSAINVLETFMPALASSIASITAGAQRPPPSGKRLCKSWPLGTCRRGENCGYTHVGDSGSAASSQQRSSSQQSNKGDRKKSKASRKDGKVRKRSKSKDRSSVQAAAPREATTTQGVPAKLHTQIRVVVEATVR